MLSGGVNGKRLRSVPLLEKQKAGIQKCIFSGCQKPPHGFIGSSVA